MFWKYNWISPYPHTRNGTVSPVYLCTSTPTPTPMLSISTRSSLRSHVTDIYDCSRLHSRTHALFPDTWSNYLSRRQTSINIPLAIHDGWQRTCLRVATYTNREWQNACTQRSLECFIICVHPLVHVHWYDIYVGRLRINKQILITRLQSQKTWMRPPEWQIRSWRLVGVFRRFTATSWPCFWSGMSCGRNL